MWYIYAVNAKKTDLGYEPDAKIPEGAIVYGFYDGYGGYIIVVNKKIEGLEPLAELSDIEPFSVEG